MARPHPALLHLAADRPLPPIDEVGPFLRSAHEHRLTGLLWSRMATGEVEVKGEDRQWLAEHETLTWARHYMLWESLRKLIARLEGLGVDVVTFKGVTAEARWYDRMGERPCYDLDLLVAPHHRHRFADVLRDLQPDHPLTGSIRPLLDRGLLQSVALWFDGTPVDLHVDLFKLGIPTRQAQRIWERTNSLSLPSGENVGVLVPEIAFIHFLVHLTKDRFRYLLGFVDVQRIIAREKLDWDFIDDFLRREGLETHVYRALEAVLATLQLPASHPFPAGWRSRLWGFLWRPSIRLQGDLGRVRFRRRGQWVLPLTARGRAPETARWWWRRLFPPAALLDYLHPGERGFYLWRLIKGRVRHSIEQRRAATHFGDLAHRDEPDLHVEDRPETISRPENPA